MYIGRTLLCVAIAVARGKFTEAVAIFGNLSIILLNLACHAPKNKRGTDAVLDAAPHM